MSTGGISIGRRTSPHDHRTSRPLKYPVDHPVIFGASAGLLWGAIMRVWMRFISTNPEFSWSGTLFILGASVIAGSVLGLARKRRAVGGVGWWRLSVLSLFLLGAGGAVMWPSVIAGAAAIGRPRPRWLRASLAVVAFAVQAVVLRSVFDDNRMMSGLAEVAAVAGYAPLITIEAWAFSVAFTPSMDSVPTPGRVKRVLMAIPLVVAATLAAVMVGLPG